MNLKWLCISAAALCLSGPVATARNIFLIPGDASGSGITPVVSDLFQSASVVGTATDVIRVLPSASPTKYYVLSRGSDTAVSVLEGTFPSLAQGRTIFVGGQITEGAVSPDGRRLVVIGPSGIAIVDTATDAVISSLGNINVGASPTDLAISLDSTRAFVLNSTTGVVTVVDLTSSSAVGALNVPARPTAVSVGPNGLVYVSAANTIYEFDARTSTGRAAIQVNGTPGKLQFSADGTLAFSVNTAGVSSRPVIIVDLVRRAQIDMALQGVTFTEMAVTGNRSAYAITSQGQLYSINIGSDNTVTSSLLQTVSNGAVPGGITRIAATGELPASRGLVIITPSQAYQLEVATNRLSDPLSKRSGDTAVVVLPTVTGTAASSFTYNTTQTVASGQNSQLLVVRAVNANGVPLSGVQVTFATSTSGVSIPNASATTNAQGYAFVTVTVPSSMTSGSIPVTASVTGASGGQFTINIGNPNLPGIGGTAGNPFQRTGLQIIAGQGQAVPALFSTGSAGYEPLTVRLTDANGAAVSGATIRWTVNGTGGTVTAQETATDATGQASVNFSAFTVLGTLTPTVVTTVSATAPTGQSVDFFVTTIRNDLSAGGGFGTVPITVQYVNTTREITLKAGEVLPNAIQAYVTSTNLLSPVAVPSIAMRIINPNADPSAGPYVECRDVYALSNAQGLVSCDLLAGSAVGDTTVVAAVGPYRENFVVHVTQGSPGSIQIVQGNNQSGNQSQVLGQSLVIEVRDAAGTPLPNVPVTWFTQLGTFTSQQNTTDFNGRASATFRLPSDRTGPITVTARASNNTEATFNITVLPAGSGGTGSGSLVAQAGGNQSAAPGQAFGQQLIVRLTDANGRVVQGQAVTFSVTSGTASVNPASATTNAQGEASTSVTAGSSAGPVVITATSGALAVTFNLTVSGGGTGPGPGTGPQFTADDILNAAGFQPGVSPGSLAYIRVRGIAPNLRGTSRATSIVGPLPTRLEGVEVLFNDIAAPVFAVANLGGEESVVVQVPYEVNAGGANVTIRSASGNTTVQNVQISAVKPGVFTFQDTGGQTFAVATRPDGSYVSSGNPARRGEEIRIYVTGVGQTISASGTNRAGIPGQTVAAQVIAGLNNAGVRVRSAEAMEGVIGVSVITMEVPLDTQTGPNQPLGFAVTGPDGQFVFANGTAVPIQ